MSEFQSAAIHDTVHEHPRPQGYLWPEPPKEAKDTLPKDFGWLATRPATARRSRACSSGTSSNSGFKQAGLVPACFLRYTVAKQCGGNGDGKKISGENVLVLYTDEFPVSFLLSVIAWHDSLYHWDMGETLLVDWRVHSPA